MGGREPCPSEERTPRLMPPCVLVLPRPRRNLIQFLREKQVVVKLMDESATEVVQELQRKKVEGHMRRAIEVVRTTGERRRVEWTGKGS